MWIFPRIKEWAMSVVAPTKHGDTEVKIRTLIKPSNKYRGQKNERTVRKGHRLGKKLWKEVNTEQLPRSETKAKCNRGYPNFKASKDRPRMDTNCKTENKKHERVYTFYLRCTSKHEDYATSCYVSHPTSYNNNMRQGLYENKRHEKMKNNTPPYEKRRYAGVV